jgi:hypothetical protein
MPVRRQLIRVSLAAVAAATLLGCTMPPPQTPPPVAAAPNLVALSTQLRGANEVPPTPSTGSGTVDALFDKNTNQLRWRVSYSDLSGPALAAHFHGPALIGANAGVAVPWPGPLASPMEGSMTLTSAQADELMSGLWYANIHTARYPGGEVRGQMTVRN